MKIESNFEFKFINAANSQLPLIIAASVGSPTDAKIQMVLDEYKRADCHLIGCFSIKKLIGVIGVQVCNLTATINYLSVLNEYRNQSIGRQFVQYAIQHFSLQNITAETDNGAVGLYHILGFECRPFEGFYGKRYHCKLDLAV